MEIIGSNQFRSFQALFQNAGMKDLIEEPTEIVTDPNLDEVRIYIY